jgi:outer membrane protein OmpA-like peptidoglycan-associated protein
MFRKSAGVYLAVFVGMFVCGTLLGQTELLAQSGAYVGLAQITNDDAVDLYPDVSPDGATVAYMSYQRSDAGRNFDIFLRKPAENTTTRLQDDGADDAFPAFNHSGDAVFFDAYRRVDKRAIWRRTVGGGADQKVTIIDRVGFGADCHPDKEWIVFNGVIDEEDIDIERDEDFWRQWRKTMPGIFLIQSDGSGFKDLKRKGLGPKWGPGGERIVYASHEYGNYEIYTIAGDGGDKLRLTTREAVDIEPAYSPDGRFIVFTSNEENHWNLWMMKADGTGLTQLTFHERVDGGPMWASDGFIYFHSNRSGNWDIWRLKPSGYEPIPPDRDGDGISNFKDQCPEKAEDLDGFQDEDGCPDEDDDNDGVPDATDQCEGEVEDTDGFQDEDGCPDPDNDNDGVLDGDDMCPSEAESANFYRDADGCPERSPVDKGDVLAFAFGFGQLSPTGSKNKAEIIRVAQAISQMPKAKIILKVYTDSRSHRANSRLTERRGERLVAALIKEGVPPDQLEAIGMGDAEPITSSTTTTGRRQNNRVVIDLAARL